jgi:hypothetical protein
VAVAFETAASSAPAVRRLPPRATAMTPAAHSAAAMRLRLARLGAACAGGVMSCRLLAMGFCGCRPVGRCLCYRRSRAPLDPVGADHRSSVREASRDPAGCGKVCTNCGTRLQAFARATLPRADEREMRFQGPPQKVSTSPQA